MKFIKFTENNDWEGESWNFWLQVDGNEKEIEEFREKISENSPYELANEIIDEKEVDTLVKHCTSGYFDSENKVKGKFNVKKIILNKNEDNLYKGGIRDFFVKGSKK